MLEVQGLAAGYGQATILRDIDLTVGSGELVALIGANGAGKSTLVKTLAGLLPARQGTISLEGFRIDALAPRQRELQHDHAAACKRIQRLPRAQQWPSISCARVV